MKRRVAIFMVVVLALMAFSGCISAKTLDGRYVLTGFEADGEDVFATLEGLGMDTNGIYMEFTSDNQFVLDSTGMDGEVITGTYRFQKEIIILESEGEEVEIFLSGDRIIFDEGGMVMTFTKSKG